MQRVFSFYGRTEKYKVCDPPINSCSPYTKDSVTKADEQV